VGANLLAMAAAQVDEKSICHQIALQKNDARLDSKLSSQAQPNTPGSAPSESLYRPENHQTLLLDY
jgi:hypothetical protein